MRLKMNVKDRRFIRSMREAEVLRDLQSTLKRLKIKKNERILLIFCGDCDQSYDFVSHMLSLFVSIGFQKIRIHFMAINGGVIRLVPQSPANRQGRSLAIDLLDEIEETCKMKKIRMILGEIHVVCGKATMAGIKVPQLPALQFTAKSMIEKRLPEVLVLPIWHVDYDGHHKKTYSIEPPDFITWLQTKHQQSRENAGKS